MNRQLLNLHELWLHRSLMQTFKWSCAHGSRLGRRAPVVVVSPGGEKTVADRRRGRGRLIVGFFHLAHCSVPPSKRCLESVPSLPPPRDRTAIGTAREGKKTRGDTRTRDDCAG